MIKRKVKLQDIVNNMIKYRGKPIEEPLSEVEALVCISTYFSKTNLETIK